MERLGKLLLFIVLAAFAAVVFFVRSGLPVNAGEMVFEDNVRFIPQNAFETTEINLSEITDTKKLWLVNKEFTMNFQDDEFETVSAYKEIPLSRSSIELEQESLQAMKKWLGAAKEAGFGGVYITSGKRSYAEQKSIYNSSSSKSFVQPPGASKHHTGLAADLACNGVSWANMGSSKVGKWLSETCGDYGYILRYPKDKTSETGIGYEPWHFRYVGTPHAYFCERNKLCLEEYLEYLDENGGYCIKIGDTYYTVYYIRPENGMVEVPKYMPYEVSGDNRDGFVITVTAAAS